MTADITRTYTLTNGANTVEVTITLRDTLRTFYGINGHHCQGGGAYASTPLSRQAALLADLGVTLMRQDAYTQAHIDTLTDTVLPGLAPVTVLPCLIFYPYDNNPNPTEQSAYDYAFGLARYAALRLAGRIRFVEFGNEYENSCSPSGDGQDITCYDNAQFQIFRGALRGSVDGWRSVDKTGQTKILISACGWLHLGFHDGLWNGKQPDGTTGHPTVRWDVTPWHWYSDMGDITRATGGSGTYNVLYELSMRFGVPIMLTEIGARPSLSEANAQAYLARAIAQYQILAAHYNIIGICVYELFNAAGDPNYGLMIDAATPKPRYTSVKSAIAERPMP